jgi:hypothetical protein
MTTLLPLSPDAQAVLDAQAKARCLSFWGSVNDLPCHPSDSGWNGCSVCVDRAGTAAAIRAAVDRVVPEQRESPAGEGEPWPRDYQLMSDSKWEQSQQIRAKFLAIAAELDGGNTTITQEIR